MQEKLHVLLVMRGINFQVRYAAIRKILFLIQMEDVLDVVKMLRGVSFVSKMESIPIAFHAIKLRGISFLEPLAVILTLGSILMELMSVRVVQMLKEVVLSVG